MDNGLYNQATKLAMQRFLAKPSHALIIVGQAGAGKSYVARALAAKLLNSTIQGLNGLASFREFQNDAKGLSIEEVRGIQNFLKLKTTGHNQIRRVCVITNAHTMSSEAQNALLKTLEEPPLDTVIILTAVPSLSLKPTIYSRAQRMSVRPADQETAVEYFTKQGYDSQTATKCYKISGGLTGLMSALITDDDAHPLVQKIEQAKSLIGQNKFERLASIDTYSKDKDGLPTLLFALRRVSQSALEQAVAKQSKNVDKLSNILQKIHATENSLSHNPNAKLLLTDLFMEL